MTKLLSVSLLTLIAVACGSSPTSPTSAPLGSGLGAPTTRSNADQPPIRTGSSEPNDAPPEFVFVLQGQPHEDFSQSAFLEVRPLEGVTKTEFSCETRRSTDQPWTVLPSLFVNLPPKVQVVLPGIGQYRCRARSVFGPGHSGTPLWTAYSQTQYITPSPDIVPADVDDCWWESVGPSFFRFRFFGRS